MSRIVVFLVGAVVLYTCLVGGLYYAQRSLIYHPGGPVTPGDYNLTDMIVRKVTTDDWVNLKGWYWPPARDDAPVIVWFHGNAGDFGDRLPVVPTYIERGYGVLLAGYRGYAGNDGTPSEEGFYHDARAWLRFIHEEGIVPQRVVLYGESLGTGVAVQMAVENPAMRALVLQAPYTSLPDVAARSFFFVPVHFMMKDQFRSIDKIEAIKMPLLIFQSTDDLVIPPLLTQRLYDAAKTDKKLVSFNGFGHNNMPVRERADALADFLAR